MGGPKWDNTPQEQRPERGLLGLRKELDLFANLRPAKCFPMLVDASPLRREVVEGTDLMVIRELTGGLYFGEPRGREEFADGGARAVNTMAYTSREIERVARVAFDVAMKRKKRLASVDKANVLIVSQLWREVVGRVAKDYPQVELEHVLVDNCAMALIQHPTRFDTLVTENTFGDILSDEAAILAGSMGMLASASLGGRVGLYEPVHGTAPDIAGQGEREPDRRDPVRRHAPAVLARPRARRRPDRGGGGAGARARGPHPRHPLTGHEAGGNDRDGRPDRSRGGRLVLSPGGPRKAGGARRAAVPTSGRGHAERTEPTGAGSASIRRGGAKRPDDAELMERSRGSKRADPARDEQVAGREETT